MATTRIIPMHMNKGRSLLQSLSARTEYVMNPEKTDEGHLVSTYECSPETVEVEFLIAKQEYQRITGREPKHGKDVIAYQIRQAFYPGEITPEEANKLGYELAMEFTKGQHQFIVATHIDKAHVHNHIVFNSTTLDCTHKFNNYNGTSEVVRDISDQLCVERGYSIIEEPIDKGKNYAEWNAEKTGTSWKQKLRNHIEEQIPGCKDFNQFLRRMELLGYEIKQGKYISFRAQDQKRFTQSKTLGEEFAEEAIRQKIENQSLRDYEAQLEQMLELQPARFFADDCTSEALTKDLDWSCKRSRLLFTTSNISTHFFEWLIKFNKPFIKPKY